MTERGLRVSPDRNRQTKRRPTALDKVTDLVVPDDLQAALDKNKKAHAYFEAFPPSIRRGILEWIGKAKKEETKEKRVAETVSLAEKNI